MWIVAWLSAAILFWVSYVFFRKWFDELNDSYAFMINALIWVLIRVPFSLYLWLDFNSVLQSWNLWFWAFGSAILSEAFVLYALSKGKISVTGTVFSIYPLFTALISIYVNQEFLNLYQVWSIVLTVFWITLIWYEDIRSDNISDRKIILSSIWFAILSAFLVWIADSYWKLTLETYWFTTFLFCLAIAQPIVATVNIYLRWLTLSSFQSIVQTHSHTKRLIAWWTFNIIWLIGFRVAFDLLYAGTASALTWTYPAIIVVLAFFFLNERISKLQYLWITIVFITIYAFSIFFV
jgi:drug/metabolite transporter (DMT)-like permease